MPESFTLNVNGAIHSVTVEPDTPLLYILRNDLALNGAKFGCGLGQCGACTVMLGDQAVRSCQLPVAALGDQAVTTLEGLGTTDKPHRLQKAFIAEQAAIRAALAGNLCRCGTHGRIIRAIRRAAKEASL